MLVLKRGIAVSLILGGAFAPSTSAEGTVGHAARTSYVRTFTIQMFRNAAITAYRGTRIPSKGDRANLRRFRRYARFPRDRPVDTRIWDRSIRMNRARRRPPLPFGNWAIPAPIVMCESGGQNLPPNGAGASGYYQILGPGSTWSAYGGDAYASEAYLASKQAQDTVASRIWAGGSGASQWVCAGLTGF